MWCETPYFERFIEEFSGPCLIYQDIDRMSGVAGEQLKIAVTAAYPRTSTIGSSLEDDIYNYNRTNDDFSMVIVNECSDSTTCKIKMRNTPGAFLRFRVNEYALTAFRPRIKSIMDIDHVYVLPKDRGQRIAECLTTEAFNLSMSQEWLVQPTCSYVRETFLPINKVYRSQLVPDISSTTQEIPLKKRFIKEEDKPSVVTRAKKRKAETMASKVG